MNLRDNGPISNMQQQLRIWKISQRLVNGRGQTRKLFPMWTVAETVDSHRLLTSSLANRIFGIRIHKKIRKVMDYIQ